jgi:hypothetical protein
MANWIYDHCHRSSLREYCLYQIDKLYGSLEMINCLRPAFAPKRAVHGAADEEGLLTDMLKRSSRYNELMVESAVACGATVIRVEYEDSIEDVADACLLELTGE